MYAFQKLRCRAKERGHEFQLTFEQYEKFAMDTGYSKMKGKTAQSLSIHRIRNDGPYSIDNIKTVTLSENSRLKYATLPDFMRAEMEEAERQSCSG